jgi:hypothetical protein
MIITKIAATTLACEAIYDGLADREIQAIENEPTYLEDELTNRLPNFDEYRTARWNYDHNRDKCRQDEEYDSAPG